MHRPVGRAQMENNFCLKLSHTDGRVWKVGVNHRCFWQPEDFIIPCLEIQQPRRWLGRQQRKDPRRAADSHTANGASLAARSTKGEAQMKRQEPS